MSPSAEARVVARLVGRHALVRELDAAEAKADEGGKKDKADAKKGGAAAATEKAPEDEAPPGAGLLLFNAIALTRIQVEVDRRVAASEAATTIHVRDILSSSSFRRPRSSDAGPR